MSWHESGFNYDVIKELYYTNKENTDVTLGNYFFYHSNYRGSVWFWWYRWSSNRHCKNIILCISSITNRFIGDQCRERKGSLGLAEKANNRLLEKQLFTLNY